MNKLYPIKERIKNFIGKKINFTDLLSQNEIYLYAGSIPYLPQYKKYVGLSITRCDRKHIKHNVLDKYPLPDNCVNIYQSEDVFEHIDPNALPMIINEIYRVLKPNGIFRLSLPDYKCDLLYNRTQKDSNGKLQFDPGGGGEFINGKVVKGGHVWFPTYESVKQIIDNTNFKNVNYLHYYGENGKGVTNKIDYSIGNVKRTPDNDDRVKNPYRPLSIVVDCIK